MTIHMHSVSARNRVYPRARPPRRTQPSPLAAAGSTTASFPTTDMQNRNRYYIILYYTIPHRPCSLDSQFVPLRQRLPADCVCKADQWLLLTRSHAVSLLGLSHQLGTPLLPLFRNVSTYLCSSIFIHEY
jgi:hypothetical protein